MVFAFIIILTSCGGPSTTPVDLNQIAETHTATVGKIGDMFRADTEFKLPDNRYIILSIHSIKKYKDYTTNNGESINNAIVIENVSTKEVPRSYIDGPGFFRLFDSYGNEFLNFNSATQTGKELPEIVLYSDETFDSIKYILFGGLDRSKNDGKGSIIFQIQ